MRAVRIHRYGGPDVIRLEETARPEPGPDEVLVRVLAAGVNPVDWKTREGRGAARRWSGERFPVVLGWDLSGTVEAVGRSVTTVRPGDEVFGLVRFPEPAGCYAEYAAVPADQVVVKPAALDHAHAAALPLVALTAWQALFDTARLTAGETVLVHAAAGGVGHVAVQLAKWKGATVIATASESKHDLVRSLGADEVVDYRGTPFEKVATGVDVVLDPVGGDTLERSLEVVREGGRVVSLVADPDEDRAGERGVGVWDHEAEELVTSVGECERLNPPLPPAGDRLGVRQTLRGRLVHRLLLSNGRTIERASFTCSDLGLGVVPFLVVIHLGELPLELELDLFLFVVALVLDADGGALRHVDALAGDLDAERPVGFESVRQPAELGDELGDGVVAVHIARRHGTILAEGDGTDRGPSSRARGCCRPAGPTRARHPRWARTR